MTQITQNIDFESARDLLETVPRACLTYASDQGPCALPVAFVWNNNRYFVGLPDVFSPLPQAGQEVVLLIDEGISFFDLRAIYIRGQIQAAETPSAARRGRWFEVVTSKIVAWDYGTLREVNDEG